MRRLALVLVVTAGFVGACSDTSAPAARSSTSSTALSSTTGPATSVESPFSGPTTTAPVASTPARQRVEIVSRVAHDRASFTEGLVWADGHLYESAGLYGESTLREVDPRTGAVTRRVALDRKYFGEGLAIVGESLIQLTWREHTAIIYRASDFQTLSTFAYNTEGWGLCDDGTRLVMSDGTDTLYFRDRSTFAVLTTVHVTNQGRPLTQINELECVNGALYANVWQTDNIVRIDPASGVVTAIVDASGLLSATDARGVDVLNGIAYDQSRGTFLITGKYWPTLFEVRFVNA